MLPSSGPTRNKSKNSVNQKDCYLPPLCVLPIYVMLEEAFWGANYSKWSSPLNAWGILFPKWQIHTFFLAW